MASLASLTRSKSLALFIIEAGIFLTAACSSSSGSLPNTQAPIATAPPEVLSSWSASIVSTEDFQPVLDEAAAIDRALSMVFPDSAEVVGTRLLRVEPSASSQAATLAWAVDFDTSSGDLNYREGAGFHVRADYLYYSLVIDADDGSFLFQVFGTPASPVYRDVQLAMSVENIDGPDVYLTPWDGAGEILIVCGHSYVIAAKDAPSPPWHQVIRDAWTNEIMRDDEIGPGASHDIYTIIRGNEAISGSQVGSAGPPPEGCPTPLPTP